MKFKKTKTTILLCLIIGLQGFMNTSYAQLWEQVYESITQFELQEAFVENGEINLALRFGTSNQNYKFNESDGTFIISQSDVPECPAVLEAGNFRINKSSYLQTFIDVNNSLRVDRFDLDPNNCTTIDPGFNSTIPLPAGIEINISDPKISEDGQFAFISGVIRLTEISNNTEYRIFIKKIDLNTGLEVWSYAPLTPLEIAGPTPIPFIYMDLQDGGCLASFGTSGSIGLYKIKGDGSLNFNKAIGGFLTQVTGIRETMDDNLLIEYWVASPSGPGDAPYVQQIDQNANTLANVYPATLLGEYLEQFVYPVRLQYSMKTSDGSLLAVGIVEGSFGGDVIPGYYAIRYDQIAGVRWVQFFPGVIPQIERAIETPDGNFLLIGDVNDDFFFAKISGTVTEGCAGELLTNPDLEDGLTAWNALGEIQTVPDGVSGNAAQLCGTGSNLGQIVPATPGVIYNASGFGKIDEANQLTSAYATLRFLTSNFAPISTAQDFFLFEEGTDFVEFNFSEVAPPGAAFAHLLFWNDNEGCMTVDETSLCSDDSAPLADLTFTNLTLEDNQLGLGDPIDFTYTLTNQGLVNAVGPFEVRYYFSTTPELTGSSSFLGAKEFSDFTTGTISTNTSFPNPNVPNNIDPGTYYLLLVVDNGLAVLESNENNNTISEVLTILDDNPVTCNPDALLVNSGFEDGLNGWDDFGTNASIVPTSPGIGFGDFLARIDDVPGSNLTAILYQEAAIQGNQQVDISLHGALLENVDQAVDIRVFFLQNSGSFPQLGAETTLSGADFQEVNFIANAPSWATLLFLEIQTQEGVSALIDNVCLTVSDLPPSEVTINCPSDITVTTDQGQNGKIVTYSSPSTFTTCSQGFAGFPILISGPPSGNFFPLGQTEVCYVISDYCGNAADCCFNVTVNPPDLGDDIDLKLNLEQSTAEPNQYAIYSITASVFNDGPGTATGVSVDFPIPDGVVYQGGNEFEASQGTFNPSGDQVWTLGSLPAGETATLTVNYFLLTPEAPLAYAQVRSANENDIDSSPNNGTPPQVNEDDEASTGNDTNDLPDLVLTNLDIQAPPILINSTLNYNVDISNLGAATALESFNVSAFISTDNVLSADDILAGVIPAGNFPTGFTVFDAGGTADLDGLSVGAYYLIVKVDANNVTIESNENNNIIMGEFGIGDPFTVTLDCPDDITVEIPFYGGIPQPCTNGSLAPDAFNFGNPNPCGLPGDLNKVVSYEVISGNIVVGDYDNSCGPLFTTGEGTAEITLSWFNPCSQGASCSYQYTQVLLDPEPEIILTCPDDVTVTHLAGEAYNCNVVENADLPIVQNINCSDPNVEFVLNTNVISGNITAELTAGILTTVGCGSIELVFIATNSCGASATCSYLFTRELINNEGIDLELSLQQTTDNPAQWSNYSVVATLTNNGPLDATDVVVDFPASDGVVYVGSDPFEVEQGTFTPFSTELWDVGTIAAGTSVTLTVNYFLLVPQAPAAYAQVQSANENDSDSTPGNGTPPTVNEDDEASTEDGSPGFVDLELQARVEQSGNFGQSNNFDFFLTVKNVGTSPATGVSVAVTQFSGANLSNSFPPFADQGSFDPLTELWTIGTVNAGQELTLKLPFILNPNTGPFKLSAEVETQNEADIDSAPGNGFSDEDDEVSEFPGRPCTLAVEILNVECVSDADPNVSNELDEFFFDIEVSGAPDGWKIFFELYDPANTSGDGNGIFTVGPVPRYMVSVGSDIYDLGFPGCTTTFADFDIVANINCSEEEIPELAFTNYELLNDVVEQGGILNYEIDLANIGTAPANGDFTVKTYISTDPQLSADDIQDGVIPTGNWPIGFLSEDVSGAASVPNNLPLGEYFLIVKVDADDDILESNENNNVGVKPFYIIGDPFPKPDLSILNIQILSGLPVAGGDEIEVSIDIQNTGEAGAMAGAQLALFLDDGSGIYSIGAAISPAIPSNQIENVTHVYEIPCSQAPGTYTLYAIIDNEDIIDEVNEINFFFDNQTFEVLTCGSSPCDDINITVNPGMIAISNANAPHVIKKVFNPSWSTELDCVDDNCDNPTIVQGLSGGTYFVQIQLFDASWAPICILEEFAEVPPGSNTQGFVQLVRPALPVQITSIQPNPVLRNSTEVMIFAQAETQQQLHCFNLLGGLEQSYDLTLNEGWNKITLDLAKLTAGTYFLQLGGQHTRNMPVRMIKLRD